MMVWEPFPRPGLVYQCRPSDVAGNRNTSVGGASGLACPERAKKDSVTFGITRPGTLPEGPAAART
jgi:hypothetical protein